MNVAHHVVVCVGNGKFEHLLRERMQFMPDLADVGCLGLKKLLNLVPKPWLVSKPVCCFDAQFWTLMLEVAPHTSILLSQDYRCHIVFDLSTWLEPDWALVKSLLDCLVCCTVIELVFAISFM
jgi:hypothetical protein